MTGTNATPPIQYGLIFPQSSGVAGNGTAFIFQGSALLPYAPATYIWRVKYVQQNSYYTNFFWSGNYGGEFPSDTGYYGCHPYPYPTNAGPEHKWEVSADFTDTQSSTDVTYGNWFVQAATVTVAASKITVNYYWNLVGGISNVVTYTSTNNFVVAGTQTLIWGDNPWPADSSEALSGTLRGLQIYSTNLSTSDILTESSNHILDAAQTSSGRSSLWYINQNPKPSDINDKSGNGHHPTWHAAARPTLYTG